MSTLVQDARYALRVLGQNPGFTTVALLTLALGIGANTAIFSLVDTVLLRPLPYRDSDRLMTVWSFNRARGFDTDQVSPLDFADWRSQNHVFESLAASTEATYTLTGVGDPALIIAYSFSADYFHVLGTPPLLGRTFLPEEEQPGKNHVAVLSYKSWQSRFGGDRDIVGKSITLDGASYTVVGVMPPGFQYPPFTELWTPFSVVPAAASDRAYRYLRVMGRLKPGVTLQQAQTDMNAIAQRLAKENPKTNKDEDAVNLISLRQMISGGIRPALLVLRCAVGFVLLIACANIANLLLGKAAGRRKEIAVRAALGASKMRLVRQFLVESILLGLAGGALGLLLAFWCTGGMVAMFSSNIFNVSIPHLDAIPIDGRALVFALAVSLLTSLIFGLLPALHAGGMNPNESLKEAARGMAGSRAGRRFRISLVVAEIALSLMLLVGAALAIESFAHLLGGDLGFNPRNNLTLRVLLPKYQYQTDTERVAFNDRALNEIKALPGVRSAGTVTFLPLSGWYGARGVSIQGQPTPSEQRPIAVWSSVSPDYFRAMGIPLLKGRAFSEQDHSGARAVAIISESLARKLLPNDDPVGKDILADGLKGPAEIVGVVGDVHQLGMTSDLTSEIYLPFAQHPASIICFSVRTVADPMSVAKAAEHAIWSVDKGQAVSYVMTMDALASESLASQRVMTTLLGIFAALALLLAAVGLYGVISYSATQRTREIGVRMALGAAHADVLKLVVGDGLRLTLLGVGLGLAGALALTRFMSSLLYGVKASDPLTFIVVAFLLTSVAVVASFIPARRAAKVDPMVALRYE